MDKEERFDGRNSAPLSFIETFNVAQVLRYFGNRVVYSPGENEVSHVTDKINDTQRSVHQQLSTLIVRYPQKANGLIKPTRANQ